MQNFVKLSNQMRDQVRERSEGGQCLLWPVPEVCTVIAALSVKSGCLVTLKGRIRLHLLKAIVSQNLWTYFETTAPTCFYCFPWLAYLYFTYCVWWWSESNGWRPFYPQLLLQQHYLEQFYSFWGCTFWPIIKLVLPGVRGQRWI